MLTSKLNNFKTKQYKTKMKENISFYANQQIKASSELKQIIPSSFSVSQQYFNMRLVRIKEKIDGLIKQHVSTDLRGTKQKTESIKEEQSGSFTSRTNAESFGRPRLQLPAQKITEQMRENIKQIYVILCHKYQNEIHLLEVTATRDQNSIETNTFELRSFIKDLRNQEKRLMKILPESMVFELDQQKKQPFKKSVIMIGQIETIVEDLKTVQQKQKLQEQQRNLQIAKELIEKAFKKRKIFNENKVYYEDKQNQKCNLFQCQLI